MRLALLAVLLVGCGPTVTSTFVTGTIGGTAFSSPHAIGDPSKGGTFDVDTILITDLAMPCAATRSDTFGVQPGYVVDGMGNRVTALVLHGESSAWFDPGGSAMRITASTAKVKIVERRDDGTLLGRFEATFGSDAISGDFIATPCTTLTPGCSAAGGLALPLLAATWLRRRATRRVSS